MTTERITTNDDIFTHAAGGGEITGTTTHGGSG